MKIVNILGGLGNQMFEYSMYLALKYAHPEEEVLICLRSYIGYPLHNGFELNRLFGVVAPEASLAQLSKLAFPFINYNSWRFMRHCLPSRKTMTKGSSLIPFNYSDILRTDSCYYDGYWQNEKYFSNIREDLLDTFSFKIPLSKRNEEIAKTISGSISVSCHIRRGDYLKENTMNVCTLQYYTNSIKMINDMVNPELLCIFSDDIEWCKLNIASQIDKKVNTVFIDWNTGKNSYIDMLLMSLCKHNIIANSSFSWWGAWLNQNPSKIVIAPKRWMNHPMANDPICNEWIRVEV